jgi:tartrate-resistant acid phosphatase type 5
MKSRISLSRNSKIFYNEGDTQMLHHLILILSLAVVAADDFAPITSSGYSFVSIGDWGGAQLGGQYEKNVNDVAKQMSSTASSVSAKFVINVGDNFYWCGIQNTSDPQIKNDYLIPYNYTSLNTVKWYSALGNHEYGYNVQAQIDYTDISDTWYLPARYYTKRIRLSSSQYASLLFLDTSPCISDYRSNNPDYWDPCMTEYPTCSQTSNADDDFEGPCQFHENILSQSCSDQYNWLKSTLANDIPSSDWLFVIGHHPIDECDVNDLTTLIQNHGFSLFLNGHTHSMNQYTIDGKGAYITTGAGSMVSTADQSHPITAAKRDGLPVTEEIRRNRGSSTKQTANSSSLFPAGHSYQTVWSLTIAGFTLHSFNSDFTELTTRFIDYEGNTVHSFVVNKQGKVIG